MSSGSSSSSQNASGRPNCHCGVHAFLFTSWTPKNPSRRFFGCRKYYIGEACDFFEWLDEKICARGKMVILPLRNENLVLHSRIQEYEKKIAEYKIMEKKMTEYEIMEKKIVDYEGMEKKLKEYDIMVAKLKGYEERKKKNSGNSS